MDAIVDNRTLQALKAKRPTRQTIGRVLMLAGVVAVVVGGLAFWLAGGRYVSTDDAYVEANAGHRDAAQLSARASPKAR